MTGARMFGGVCDRCAQTYLQSHFPVCCLCPRCLPDSLKATERDRLPALTCSCRHQRGYSVIAGPETTVGYWVLHERTDCPHVSAAASEDLV